MLKRSIRRFAMAGSMVRRSLPTNYTSPTSASPPDDFLKELRKNKNAETFFKTLNEANVHSIVYRLETAKQPETRERRMKTILAMMERGKAFHP